VTLVDGSTHEALFKFTRELPPVISRRNDDQASAPKKPKAQEPERKQEKPKKAVKVVYRSR
jgi:hypothetical protein